MPVPATSTSLGHRVAQTVTDTGVWAEDQQQLAEQLLAQAREPRVELVGPGGLLNQLTKKVMETALEAEMSDHLGYDKHHPAGRNRGNSRNGSGLRRC